MIRLYRAPFSTNVERVALALAHKGLEVESVWISYEDRSPVERVSGQSLVPVVEFEDGAVVFDSMQIVRVLEERFARAPPLYPASFAGRARVIRFIDWFNDVWKVAPNAIEAEISAPEVAPDVARVDAAGRGDGGGARSLRGQARGRSRGTSSATFGAADCAAYPFLKYAAWRDPGGRRVVSPGAGRLPGLVTTILGWRRGSSGLMGARGCSARGFAGGVDPVVGVVLALAYCIHEEGVRALSLGRGSRALSLGAGVRALSSGRGFGRCRGGRGFERGRRGRGAAPGGRVSRDRATPEAAVGGHLSFDHVMHDRATPE